MSDPDRLSPEVLANLRAIRAGEPWPCPEIAVPLYAVISPTDFAPGSTWMLTPDGEAVLALADERDALRQRVAENDAYEAAWAAGAQAACAGQPVQDCPYTDEALCRAWVSGYAHDAWIPGGVLAAEREGELQGKIEALRKRVADFERLLTEPRVEQARLLALREAVDGLGRHVRGEMTADSAQVDYWRREILESVIDTLPDVLDEALAANLHRRLNKGVAGALGLLEMQKDPETGESYLSSWHDMPERVAALVQEGEALREQVKAMTDERAALLAPVEGVDPEEVLRLGATTPKAATLRPRSAAECREGLLIYAAPLLAREVIRLRAALRLADEQSAEAIKRVSSEILADKWNSTADLQAEVERLRAAQRDAFKDGQIAALEKTTPIANDIAAQRDGSERRAQAMAARLAALEPVLSAAAQIMGVQSVTPTTPEEGGDYAAKLWDRINASVAAAEEARLTLLAEQGKPEGAPPGWSYKPGDPDFDEPGEWVHKKLRLKVWKSGTGWVWGRKERSGVFVGPSEQEDGQPARVVMLAATAAVK